MAKRGKKEGYYQLTSDKGHLLKFDTLLGVEGYKKAHLELDPDIQFFIKKVGKENGEKEKDKPKAVAHRRRRIVNSKSRTGNALQVKEQSESKVNAKRSPQQIWAEISECLEKT